MNLKEEEELCAAEDLSAEYGCGTAAFAVGVAGGKRSTYIALPYQNDSGQL